MTHLIRAGLLLVAFVAGFAAMRMIAPPAFLVDLGFHQVTESNAAEWAAHPALFADTADCQTCHEDVFAVRQAGNHAGVSCENCHGPATAHVQEGARVFILTSREACGACHDEVVGRPSGFPQVDLADHGVGAECITCHSPHKAAAPPAAPHELAGRSDCLSCHAVDGFVPAPEDHAGRGSDACQTCHRSGE